MKGNTVSTGQPRAEDRKENEKGSREHKSLWDKTTKIGNNENKSKD